MQHCREPIAFSWAGLSKLSRHVPPNLASLFFLTIAPLKLCHPWSLISPLFSFTPSYTSYVSDLLGLLHYLVVANRPKRCWAERGKIHVLKIRRCSVSLKRKLDLYAWKNVWRKDQQSTIINKGSANKSFFIHYTKWYDVRKKTIHCIDIVKFRRKTSMYSHLLPI